MTKQEVYQWMLDNVKKYSYTDAHGVERLRTYALAEEAARLFEGDVEFPGPEFWGPAPDDYDLRVRFFESLAERVEFDSGY